MDDANVDVDVVVVVRTAATVAAVVHHQARKDSWTGSITAHRPSGAPSREYKD